MRALIINFRCSNKFDLPNSILSAQFYFKCSNPFWVLNSIWRSLRFFLNLEIWSPNPEREKERSHMWARHETKLTWLNPPLYCPLTLMRRIGDYYSPFNLWWNLEGATSSAVSSKVYHLTVKLYHNSLYLSLGTYYKKMSLVHEEFKIWSRYPGKKWSTPVSAKNGWRAGVGECPSLKVGPDYATLLLGTRDSVPMEHCSTLSQGVASASNNVGYLGLQDLGHLGAIQHCWKH